jgi:hypothetical protein
MPRFNHHDDLKLDFEAFKVDVSWYESHWLQEDAPHVPGIVQRSFAAVASALWRATQHLPVLVSGVRRARAGKDALLPGGIALTPRC